MKSVDATPKSAKFLLWHGCGFVMSDEAGSGFAILVVFALIYFVPTFVAHKSRQLGGIFALNLLLGWTLVGWAGALVWAIVTPKPTNARYANVWADMRDDQTHRAPGALVLLTASGDGDAPRYSVRDESAAFADITGEEAGRVAFYIATSGIPKTYAGESKNGRMIVRMHFPGQ